MSPGVHSRRVRLLLAALVSAAALLALPSAASAVPPTPSVTFNGYTMGWCCSGNPLTAESTFHGNEFEIFNSGGVDLALDKLRVTYDSTQYRWETGADANTNDSEVYAGFDNGAWTSTYDYYPISSAPPGTCVVESTIGTQVTYVCDLQASPVAVGDTGWVGIKSLVPLGTFHYGSAPVDYSVSYVGGVLPPSTYTEPFEFVDIASNLHVQGGYTGDPALLDQHYAGTYRDFDGESTGVTYHAGSVVPYKFLLSNPAHGADPTGFAHGVTIDFNIPTDSVNDWETQFQPGSVSVTGGLSNPDCTITQDNGTDQDWRCAFDGHLSVGGTSVVTLPLLLVDGVDLNTISFRVDDANGTIDSLPTVEDSTYGSPNSCQLPRFFGSQSPSGSNDEFVRYTMYGTASIAAIESGSPIRFQLPCVEPNASQTNYSSTFGIWDAVNGYSTPGSHAGVFRGPANASYSWLSNEPVTPGPSNAYAFTWEGVGVTGTAPGDIVDSARIAGPPLAGGDYYRIVFHVTADSASDLGVTLGGPAALEVASGGSQASYTATVSNAGPQAARHAKVAVQLPATATFVSGAGGAGGDACSAAGQLVTCTMSNVASGATRAFTIVASYRAGVKGLTLPATVNASAIVTLTTLGATDPAAGNDAATHAIALAAPKTTTTEKCPEGQTGTPPNCSKTITGGTTNTTYTGSDGGDTFTGGSGNETFRAGPGGDTAYGGGGNDRLYGGTGDDTFYGGPGNDRLYGGEGSDRLFGGAGDDWVHGNGDDDEVHGGIGNDRVSCGGGGRETVYGDAGNDVASCIDGKRGDTINGGPGTDLCMGDIGDTFVGCERIVRIALPF